MVKITACTIARNEEQHIASWLKNVQLFADEIVVVDTGSTDETMEIVKKAGARLENFVWCDDFSAAKNYALDCCTGDWILMPDADEYFTAESQKRIRRIIEKFHQDSLVAGFITPFTNIDVNRNNEIISRSVQMRIFRREKELRFCGKVHEALANLRPEGNNRDFVFIKELEFIHTGYSFANSEAKQRRNLDILLSEIKEQGGESPRQFGYLQDCYMGLQEYEKAVHYGRLAMEHRAESGLLGQESKVLGQILEALYRLQSPDYAAEIEKNLREFPQLPEVWVHKGRQHLAREELKEAETAFLKALSLRNTELKQDLAYSRIEAMLPEIQAALVYIKKYKPYYTFMQAEEYAKAANVAVANLADLYIGMEKQNIAPEYKYIFPETNSQTGEHFTSIIILNYNLALYTRNLIESIRRNTKTGSYEIIVVDNGSTDDSVPYLRQQKDVRLIVNAENMGFPKGCNQGMEAARGDEILLLNNDTLVTYNWLSNLRKALYSDTAIGAVGPVTNSCSNRQQIDVPYENKLTEQSMADMYAFARDYNHSNPGKWYKWMSLVGYCLLLKQEVYQKIGNLDERYFPGNFEDDDYCLRIRQAGYELLLCEDTFVHHFGSVSFLKGSREKQKKYNMLNGEKRQMFLAKWHLDDAHYKMWRTLIDEINVAEGGRIIEYASGSTMDLYVLARNNPQVTISGTTKNRQDVYTLGCSFPLRYTANLAEFVTSLDGLYDCIIIPEDFAELESEESLARIIPHLRPGGCLYIPNTCIKREEKS